MYVKKGCRVSLKFYTPCAVFIYFSISLSNRIVPILKSRPECLGGWKELLSLRKCACRIRSEAESASLLSTLTSPWGLADVMEKHIQL